MELQKLLEFLLGRGYLWTILVCGTIASGLALLFFLGEKLWRWYATAQFEKTFGFRPDERGARERVRKHLSGLLVVALRAGGEAKAEAWRQFHRARALAEKFGYDFELSEF